ncbi:MAG: TIR domain-containing protein [Oscillospiraceae bacterium]|nr:TIR domain-containing protein [Oscillospiraceae bacterium]MBQ8797573.1 TIR domain-containing protein [Oscillospiraceae bacterium]
MAIIKCKMCGGDLNLVEGASTAECEYCGSVQTVPKVDDEKKLTLFARANRLRAACEFDKAAGIYESIVADFPEEAEAYWGLVLCKYGIEYVDDPGTGKKIPTCHRSSFDSIMDDTDFEQAQENADSIARKVYREEAKQIEELRKGIIAVSANEEPYDIFICYKETAENGERTLDSVLAQDVYDALTDKGYRVFFSRITLEDKLGVEYEPYIFAALNSAKIMLAFGTDYDYFNAVWVKNEWSRFLKLMASDKEKHLIPCYKGIDAYDMPKEFAKLQAQDLGKVGATQDLLRGIAKILPRQEATPVTKPATAGSFGETAAAPLLKRGYMALEDGAWSEADNFFDQALNLDAENAHAYLGKALAEEKCADLKEFSRKRIEITEDCEKQEVILKARNGETLTEEESQHIQEMISQYTLGEWLPEGKIRSLYDVKDQRFFSEIEPRRRQIEEEKAFWADRRFLNRAKQFSEEIKQNIEQAQEKVLDVMRDRLEQAQHMNRQSKENTRQLLADSIAAVDQIVIRLHEEVLLQQMEPKYRKACECMQKAKTVEQFREAKKLFVAISRYKDSLEKAKLCRTQEEELLLEMTQAQKKRERREKLLKEKWDLEQELESLGIIGMFKRGAELERRIAHIERELIELKYN